MQLAFHLIFFVIFNFIFETFIFNINFFNFFFYLSQVKSKSVTSYLCDYTYENEIIENDFDLFLKNLGNHLTNTVGS